MKMNVKGNDNFCTLQNITEQTVYYLLQLLEPPALLKVLSNQ